MKHAIIFPGQGSQFPGMGKSLYESNDTAKKLFEQANDILGFNISAIMFGGTEAELKQTKVTQPAIFLHSVITFLSHPELKMDMAAGHSLGEFSALVANGVLSFEDGIRLVAVRANAMQKACEATPSSMAAILGLDDKTVEDVCSGITDEIVVPANYNCPGQIVISGSTKGVEIACEKLKAAGAKRALLLPVGGAFHSPLMLPAQEELKAMIDKTPFNTPSCPVYQNVVSFGVTDPTVIRQNLIKQLTGAVRWTQTIQNMISDGAGHFTEVGPGKVLQGLVLKIDKSVAADGLME